MRYVIGDIVWTILSIVFAILTLAHFGQPEAREFLTLAMGSWIISEIYSIQRKVSSS